jgi:hypothetical protein
MSGQTGVATIDVGVTYAGSRKGPWKQAYEPSTQLAKVRDDAMGHFEVADSTDAAGNQIVYKLMHGGDTLNDLTKTVGAESGDKPHLELRLVRQVIAG